MSETTHMTRLDQRLARIEDRQEAVIGAVTGLADTIAILSEQIGALIDDCAAPEIEPGKDLHSVLTRVADQLEAQTEALGALTKALDTRGA